MRGTHGEAKGPQRTQRARGRSAPEFRARAGGRCRSGRPLFDAALANLCRAEPFERAVGQRALPHPAAAFGYRTSARTLSTAPIRPRSHAETRTSGRPLERSEPIAMGTLGCPSRFEPTALLGLAIGVSLYRYVRADARQLRGIGSRYRHRSRQRAARAHRPLRVQSRNRAWLWTLEERDDPQGRDVRERRRRPTSSDGSARDGSTHHQGPPQVRQHLCVRERDRVQTRVMASRDVSVYRGRRFGWWVKGRRANGGLFMLTWWPTERMAETVARWFR